MNAELAEVALGIVLGILIGWDLCTAYRDARIKRFRAAIKAMTQKDWQITAEIWCDSNAPMLKQSDGWRFIGRIDATYVAGVNEGVRMERRRVAGEEHGGLIAAIEKLG